MKQKRRKKSKLSVSLKRVLLHPLNYFMLLCLGVILVLTTFSATAEGVNVTATVPPNQQTETATCDFKCFYNETISQVKHWNHVLWPAYGMVTLMTASFWLGEKEILWRLSSRFASRGRSIVKTRRLHP